MGAPINPINVLSTDSVAAVEAKNTGGGDGVLAGATGTKGNGIHASQGSGSGIGNTNPCGVWGESETGNGVLGQSKSGPGVAGRSTTGDAGYFHGNVKVLGRVIWGGGPPTESVNINGADGGIFATGNARIEGTLTVGNLANHPTTAGSLTVGGVNITGAQLNTLLVNAGFPSQIA